MDQRVSSIMRMLRAQELPALSNLHAIVQQNIPKAKQKMSLKEIANEVGLSESRARTLFKSDVGLTPGQYIKKLKIDAAAEIARDTYLRVAEIAAILGVNDNSHFLRDFKKAYGMTLTKYRKLHQRRPEEDE